MHGFVNDRFWNKSSIHLILKNVVSGKLNTMVRGAPTKVSFRYQLYASLSCQPGCVEVEKWGKDFRCRSRGSRTLIGPTLLTWLVNIEAIKAKPH